MSDEKKAKEPIHDDEALFEVVGFLMEKLATSQDIRVAEIAEVAIKKCQEDPQIVAKLLIQLAAAQKTPNQELYNPFMPRPMQRTQSR